MSLAKPLKRGLNHLNRIGNYILKDERRTLNDYFRFFTFSDSTFDVYGPPLVGWTFDVLFFQ